MSRDLPSSRQPLYSPVPLEVVQGAVEQSSFSETVVPTVVEALDELQLALLGDPRLGPDRLRARAARSRHLFADEYPGSPDDPFSSLLVLTGEIARTYFDEHLPDLDPVEAEAVRHVLTEYASHPGIGFAYEPEVTPVVTRVVSHDALVEAEPGPLYPPQPARQPTPSTPRGVDS